MAKSRWSRLLRRNSSVQSLEDCSGSPCYVCDHKTNNHRRADDKRGCGAKIELCSRHRCTVQECPWAREDQIKSWHCQHHRETYKSIPGPACLESQTASPQKDEALEVSRTNTTHGVRFEPVAEQSLKHDPPGASLRRASIFGSILGPRGRASQPQNSKRFPDTASPKLSSERVLQYERRVIGWHQCHAPGCRDRCLKEDVWVCRKHLEQGWYDANDPPGFANNPSG